MLHTGITKPAFWLCAGILISGIQPWLRLNSRFAKISLRIGVALVAAYALCAGLHLLSALPAFAGSALLWLLTNTVIFLFPGILIGFGLHK